MNYFSFILHDNHKYRGEERSIGDEHQNRET